MTLLAYCSLMLTVSHPLTQDCLSPSGIFGDEAADGILLEKEPLLDAEIQTSKDVSSSM